MEFENERLVAEIPKPLKEAARRRAKERGLDLKSLVVVLLEKETGFQVGNNSTENQTEPLAS
jgi:hypothetical protein